MTAVVAILNKKGVALAADSAVTRTKGRNEKVTKNGNKMIRLSNVVPICVMLTGNGSFLRTQWDIIIRHYRQHRGDIKHETVEACMHDFFRYIADNNLFVDQEFVLHRTKMELSYLFKSIDGNINENIKKRDEDGCLTSPRSYQRAFVKLLNQYSKSWLKNGVCPQFTDYALEKFDEYTKNIFVEFFEENCYNEDVFFQFGRIPQEVLTSLHEPLARTLLIRLTTRRDDDEDRANLIFSGYGDKQDYPSLVSTIVCEGFDNRVNYHVQPSDIIYISDKRPVAICPFAQADVINSILTGSHRNFIRQVADVVNNSFDSWNNFFFDSIEDDDIDFIEFREKLEEVKTDDLLHDFYKQMNRNQDTSRHQWVKALENYDLQSMAALAESLIDLTGFHRILTFQQEGVGGPVDVAVISKSDGYVWLNRKSWYHHKDIGGQYGKLGV